MKVGLEGGGWFEWIRWVNSTSAVLHSTLLTLHILYIVYTFQWFCIFQVYFMVFILCTYVCCMQQWNLFVCILLLYCSVHIKSIQIRCNSTFDSFQSEFHDHSLQFYSILYNSIIIWGLRRTTCCTHIPTHRLWTENELWSVNLWSDVGIVNNYCQKLDLIRKA